MIRALLVDDHAVVRFGFRLLLENAEDIEVSEAEDGESGYQQYLKLKATPPDVVIMDLSMPGIGGIEAVRRIRRCDPTAKILALSAHDNAVHADRALRHGALGFLSKRCNPNELLLAVRTVAAGRRYNSRYGKGSFTVSADQTTEGSVNRLSEREFEVFLRLAKGETAERIATELNVSASTVGTHLYNVKQKLGAVNQAELTLLAVRLGLIEV